MSEWLFWVSAIAAGMAAGKEFERLLGAALWRVHIHIREWREKRSNAWHQAKFSDVGIESDQE